MFAYDIRYLLALHCILLYRFQALAKYTRDTVGDLMGKYIANNITLDELSAQVTDGWKRSLKMKAN